MRPITLVVPLAKSTRKILPSEFRLAIKISAPVLLSNVAGTNVKPLKLPVRRLFNRLACAVCGFTRYTESNEMPIMSPV